MPNSVLSTVGAYKSELNINSVLKLTVQNEEDKIPTYITTGREVNLRATGRDLGHLGGGNDAFFLQESPMQAYMGEDSNAGPWCVKRT